MTVSARLKTNWSHYTYLKQDAERVGRLPPTTAACPPAPSKIFAIKVVDFSAPQQGPFLTFDALSKPASAPEASIDALAGKPGNKKRWSLLGKVLTMNAPGPESPKQTPDEALEEARRETAVARARPSSATPPPPPPKPSASLPSAFSDDSSAGSSPSQPEPQRIWRFELENCFYPPPQARERPIGRPRLPAPAQARVTARTRSGSTPPPPAARMPAPTRRVSGLKEGGLVNGARNASPTGSPTPSLPSSPRLSDEPAPQLTFSPSLVRTLSEPLDGLSPSVSEGSIRTSSSTTSSGMSADAVAPTGVWAANARYAGRALAEWALVVAECNSFVDRRRDEGVLGLSEVEVPLLVTQGPAPRG